MPVRRARVAHGASGGGGLRKDLWGADDCRPAAGLAYGWSGQGGSGQVSLDFGHDDIEGWESVMVLLSDAHVAHPDGEFTPVARHDEDHGDRESGLEMFRQPGGTGFVVSNHAVADLDRLHGDSC